MKAKGKPFGQAFGHSINDPNNWCYPLVWMWGGLEVRADGRTVVLNSKNTVEAVKFNNVLWKEVFDEGGLAWDDSNNNRAFLSSEISLTGSRPLLLAAGLELGRPALFEEREGRQGRHPLLHGPRAVRPVLRDDGHLRHPGHEGVPRRQVGHAGPPGRKATEALSKYIVVDMFAKSIQGMKPEDAVTWAAGELRKIYEAS